MLVVLLGGERGGAGLLGGCVVCAHVFFIAVLRVCSVAFFFGRVAAADGGAAAAAVRVVT